MNNPLIDKYFRAERLPHIWCPGCGHGIIMHSIVKGIEAMGWDRDSVVIVSGIGCSSRAPGYMDFNTLHTTHGRALAFATGIKLANPKLNIVVVSGDGDAAAIGGNHLIHAARRNIDLTVIVFNNNIYGMTGGQYSPTTPFHELGTTAPYGTVDPPFDIAKLAMSAGATYSARTTCYHVPIMDRYIKAAMAHKGFSLVEAVSICPTYYGRKNKKGSAVKMMQYLKDNYVDFKKAAKMTPEQLEGKKTMGQFDIPPRPEYTELYEKIIEDLSKGVKDA